MTPDKVPLSRLGELAGREVGASEWITVDQTVIDRFADVTMDDQFIHVDPVRAATTPFGGTIAHGFLSVSLLSRMSYDALPAFEGVEMGVNYGMNRLRFLAPVKPGNRIRGRFVLRETAERSSGQTLLTYDVTVEIEDEDKPALVAEWLTLLIHK